MSYDKLDLFEYSLTGKFLLLHLSLLVKVEFLLLIKEI